MTANHMADGARTSAKALAEYRAAHVPLYNAQPLKLGLFAINLDHTTLCSSIPTSFELSWPHSLTIAEMADRIGLELIVPAARWAGFGGKIDFQQRTFETATYAAGLLASTKNTMVFSTIHASFIHPVVAAKMIMTMDHVGQGRAGLNVVMGWNEKEMDMLGVELLGREGRYQRGNEWIEIVDRIWQDPEPFDFNGEFYRLKGAQGDPKPIQPRPVVVNAGGSPAGVAYSTKYADFNFMTYGNEEKATGYVKQLKEKAWTEHGRDIGMMSGCVLICRDTEAEAKAVQRSFVEHGDLVAARNYAAAVGVDIENLDDAARTEYLKGFVSLIGGTQLVGTPEQVVEGLLGYQRAGIGAVLITLIDYIEDLDYFERRVLPLMKQAGLRL